MICQWQTAWEQTPTLSHLIPHPTAPIPGSTPDLQQTRLECVNFLAGQFNT